MSQPAIGDRVQVVSVWTVAGRSSAETRLRRGLEVIGSLVDVRDRLGQQVYVVECPAVCDWCDVLLADSAEERELCDYVQRGRKNPPCQWSRLRRPLEVLAAEIVSLEPLEVEPVGAEVMAL